MSRGVWLVWSLIATSGDHHLTLTAVCASQATALGVVQEERRRITAYHGPYYPPKWQHQPNRLLTQYGDEIHWEPEAVME